MSVTFGTPPRALNLLLTFAIFCHARELLRLEKVHA